jgi:cobaltochelatase CobS
MTAQPKSIAPDVVAALLERHQAVSAHMTERQADFARSIFATIHDRQGGFATAKQRDTLESIVSSAERRAAGPRADFEVEDDAAAPPAAKPAPAAPADAAGQLAALIGQLAGASVNAAQVAEIARAEVAKALADTPAVRIELTRGGALAGDAIDGHQHPQFPRLCRALSARQADGYAPSVWIAGPAGSGKTHAAKTFAKAAGLAFHYNGALSMPHELLGFIDAGGRYHRTPFRDAYEHGGVYLFDEVDASDNAALLALNAALANGRASFPDAQVERHADCTIIATANTWGLGATADYVGRAKIDAAFLSRFPVRLSWDYDVALEQAISGDVAFARRVQAARARARAAGLKVLIDPRATMAGAALLAAGFASDEAAELTYLANLSADQRRIVEG